jgi:hypothetical protein
MSIDWKKIAIAAAAALLLSILAGVIRGVSFGPLALRALAFALLAGVLVQVIILVVRRYLPELSDGGQAPAEFSEDEDTGRNVDIVLPPEDGSFKVERRAASLGERVTDEEFEGEFAEEVEEIKAHPIVTSEPGTAPKESFVARPPDVLDDVDVLPDLESLSDAFASPIRSGGEEADDSASRGFADAPSFSAPMRSEGSGLAVDPATAAAAMRTLLKRDLKG